MNNIHDLRTALDFLREIPGQVVETDVEVDPEAELCGVYRYVGAGGTVPRPTKEGPVMIFNNVKGHPDARVVIGLLASRTRVARMLDADPRRLGFLLNDAVLNPIPPVEVPAEEAVCQEVVHLATEEGFDIRKLVPAPTNTPEDAGPYITLGMAYASDPETGESDVTIHRLCLQSKDEISIYMVPGSRHIARSTRRQKNLVSPCLFPSALELILPSNLPLALSLLRPLSDMMNSTWQALYVASPFVWRNASQSTSVASLTLNTLLRESCYQERELQKIRILAQEKQCPNSLATQDQPIHPFLSLR